MVRPAPGAGGSRLTGAGALAPLIVTADLPEALQSRADQLRRAHFPPDRNHLAAHVTLFHALPPSVEDELRDALAGEARAKPPAARLSGIMNLGRGTALRIESPATLALWERLADRFHGLLTPQDEHTPRLHVTIQNKVSPAQAKALLADLSAGFRRHRVVVAGLAAWYYRGGPWEPISRHMFA